MANIKSSKKRARQNIKRRINNKYYRTSARTYLKQARALIDAGDFTAAETVIQSAAKMLDKAAQKGIIHANNAARRKSRIMRALSQARAEAAAVPVE